MLPLWPLCQCLPKRLLEVTNTFPNQTATALKHGNAILKGARSRYFSKFCIILSIMSSKRKIKALLQLRMIFPLCKWYFNLNWQKFEKRWADVFQFFQIYPNAIRLNPLQFFPSMPLLGFPVFCFSSSIVLNRYFHILVNSMTIWSLLKLPKIAWPSPFKGVFSKS